jgi:hypothetical protein
VRADLWIVQERLQVCPRPGDEDGKIHGRPHPTIGHFEPPPGA